MSVFISYSTKDSVFVGRLAGELIKKRINVWVDKFEMQPGDSLIDKIQEGLQNADFLIVVLSKSSVESQWCRKELNTIMMSEIEEDKTRIIPILIEDCQVPLFLKEKLYADFRSNFEIGLGELLRPLSKLIKEKVGRKVADEAIVDYGVNWGLVDGLYQLTIDFVVWMEKQQKSIILQVIINGNQEVTNRYLTQVKSGLNFLMKESLILYLCEEQNLKELNLIVSTDNAYLFDHVMEDTNLGLKFDIRIRAVLLGVDNGNDIVLNFIDYLEILEEGRAERMNAVSRKAFP